MNSLFFYCSNYTTVTQDVKNKRIFCYEIMYSIITEVENNMIFK